MKVLHIIAGDLSGGAARGAYWLHRALKEQGVESVIFTNSRTTNGDPDVYLSESGRLSKLYDLLRREVDSLATAFYFRRIKRIFSTGLAGVDFTKNEKYKDADIVTAEEVTYITTVSKRSASFYILWALIGVLAVGVVVALTRKTKGEEEEEVKGQFALPGKVSVVSVLSFLNQIRQSNHPLAADTQLKSDIETLEKSYFTKEPNGSSDLNGILNNWHTKVS